MMLGMGPVTAARLWLESLSDTMTLPCLRTLDLIS